MPIIAAKSPLKFYIYIYTHLDTCIHTYIHIYSALHAHVHTYFLDIRHKILIDD